MTHDYQPHDYQLSAELEATCPEPNNPKGELHYQFDETEIISEEFMAELAERLAPTVREAIKAFKKICLAIYRVYDKQNHPRVAHLAAHSKKARVRKKNKARLMRLLQTELKER